MDSMRSLFMIIVCLSTVILNAQDPETYICGNGKFAMELNQCIIKADSFIKRGQKCEAINLLLPFAFDDTFGENEACQKSIDLIKSMYSKKDLIAEFNNGLKSVRVEKSYDSRFGESRYLLILFFGNEVVLSDRYYWLGAPKSKELINRNEIDECVSIEKSKIKIQSIFFSRLVE